MTPPPGFLTLTPIPGPNANELPPITTYAFTAKTPENTPLAHRAFTLANPEPMINPAFVEDNNEVFESLLRERRKQICNEDLRTELEYFSEEYDEERDMESRLARVMETILILYTKSLRARRQRERGVEFEDALNRDGSRVHRNSKGGRPSKQRAQDNRAVTPPWGEPLPTTPIRDMPRRSLVEFLSTDLPTTYKGLMEKTYTWIDAKEVATNGALNDHRESFDRLKKKILLGQQ
ncbi:hypothetical protein Tco_0748104 [Tanacetum coccineum]|uniref:Uncharacterized protein n=1 Tax=Tanacetum coccineum TaxID=301880 RepID=A0ABQ4YY31_9ASTR